MRPDAPFNNSLPVAWQERQARGEEEECSALLSAAALLLILVPMSQDSGLVPQGRWEGEGGGGQPADH